MLQKTEMLWKLSGRRDDFWSGAGTSGEDMEKG